MPTARRTLQAQLTGYVLHHYDWSESSLILDLLTREQGRIVLVAKGAKRPYSQLRAVLLQFQRIHVTLSRARANSESDIRTLRSAEWAGGPAMLTGAALFSGFYLNELLLKFLARDDPHATLFDAYSQALTCLAAAPSLGTEATLRAFELTLLREVGVLPDLSLLTSSQQPLQPRADYALLSDVGVSAACADAPRLSGATLLALQAALARGELDELRRACASALPELKIAVRNLLHYHLGSDQLRTRQVLLTLPRHPQPEPIDDLP